MTLEQIEQELEELDILRNRLKKRAMIFQVDEKEKLAQKLGKPLDSFYDLKCDDWIKLKLSF